MNISRNLSKVIYPTHCAVSCRVIDTRLNRLRFMGTPWSVRNLSVQHQHTNRLANAKSPYLLQHADNPVRILSSFRPLEDLTHSVSKVDWYEWDSEAFDKAIREDKPIFLSVGYSACHCVYSTFLSAGRC